MKKKKFIKYITVLMLAMMVCSLFSMSASATDHIHVGGTYIIGNNEYRIISISYGSDVMAISEESVWCGCDTSNNIYSYVYSHTHDFYTGCTVVVREYCYTCGNYRDVTCQGIGGCSSFAGLPDWPGFPG